MGSELSIESCLADVQNCTFQDESSSQHDVLVVELQQPFGMTLCSEVLEKSIVKTVSECEVDGNAAAAGVVKGMILLQINSADMQDIDLDTLSKILSTLPPKKAISMTFFHPSKSFSRVSQRQNQSPGNCIPESSNPIKCPEKHMTEVDIQLSDSPDTPAATVFLGKAPPLSTDELVVCLAMQHSELADKVETVNDTEVDTRAANIVKTCPQEDISAALRESERRNLELSAKLRVEQEELQQLRAEQAILKEEKLQIERDSAVKLDEMKEELSRQTQSCVDRVESSGIEAPEIEAIGAAKHSQESVKKSSSSVILSLQEAMCTDIFVAEEKTSISQTMVALRNGIPVKKHNRLVSPSAKWLHVDSLYEKLYWRNEIDNGLKKSKSQKSLFGKCDSEREIYFSDILEVSTLIDLILTPMVPSFDKYFHTLSGAR